MFVYVRVFVHVRSLRSLSGIVFHASHILVDCRNDRKEGKTNSQSLVQLSTVCFCSPLVIHTNAHTHEHGEMLEVSVQDA